MGQSVLNEKKRSNMIWRFVGAFLLATGFLSFGIWNMYDNHFKIKKDDDEKEKIEVQKIKTIIPLLDSLSAVAASIKLYNDDVIKLLPEVKDLPLISSPFINANYQINQYNKYLSTNNDAIKNYTISRVFSALTDYINFTKKVHDYLITRNLDNKLKTIDDKQNNFDKSKESGEKDKLFNTLVAKLKEEKCGKKILEELGIK